MTEDDKLRRAIDETRAFIASRTAPDLTASVMQQIAQQDLRPAAIPRSGFFGRGAPSLWAAFWKTRDVSFTFRPAYGLAAVAAVALLLLFVPMRHAVVVEAPQAAVTEPQLLVQFRLQAPDASDVRLAGSFTGWEARYALHQAAPGLWTVTLQLPRGVHDYAFVVDGMTWVADPFAQQVNDGFGGVNSRIALLPPDTPQI
jgi:hypothetical protein